MDRSPATRPLAECLVPLCERELARALAAASRRDAEALHDCRVALRRLKVIVKHHACAGAPRRKVLRRVARVMKASNAGRDAQVMLAWLEALWPRLGAVERRGARQWRHALHKAMDGTALKSSWLTARLERLVPLLGRLLPTDALARQPFGAVTAQQLAEQARQLTQLREGPASDAQLHAIRLQMKRLRYLLLPFVDSLAACQTLARTLQGWQDRLGAWHDTLLRQQSLQGALRHELAALAHRTGRALAKGEGVEATALVPALPGLLALARRNGTEQRRREAALWRELCSEAAVRLDQQLQSAIAELRRAARG